MSKKKTKKEKEVQGLDGALSAVESPEFIESVEQLVAKEIHKEEAITEMSFTLDDAARRFIVGYKEGWLAGIRAHISSYNMPLEGSEAYFKHWFVHFGLKVK